MKKGFTLIELLISIVIVSIISTPLLHAFISSAKVNGKARLIQNATSIVQTVVENLKSYSLEDISRDFNHYTVDSRGENISVGMATDGSFEAYKEIDVAGTVTYKKVNARLSTDLIVDEQKSSSVEAYKQGDTIDKTVFIPKSEYSFVVKNALNDDSNNFDLVISAQEADSTSIPNIMSMNRSDCAYYAESKVGYNDVIDEYKMRNEVYSATPVTTKNIEDQLKRTITIDFTKNESHESVSVTTDWSLLNLPGQELVYDADKDQQTKVTVFNNYASQEDLKAIYIYYYPIVKNGEIRDRFVVNNDTGLKISVFLIAMEESNVVDEAGKFHTNNYKTSVVVNDNDESGLRLSKAWTTICTNSKSNNWMIEYPMVRPEGWLGKENMGNSTELATKIDTTVEAYRHNESSWTDESFTPNPDDFILQFTGGFLDESEIQ